MPEYTRRPLAVTAYQFDGSEAMGVKLYHWYVSCKGVATPILSYDDAREMVKKQEKPTPAFRYDPVLGLLSITTPNGAIELSTGDWLVQTPGHDFYRMSHEDFTEEHQPILKPVDA